MSSLCCQDVGQTLRQTTARAPLVCDFSQKERAQGGALLRMPESRAGPFLTFRDGPLEGICPAFCNLRRESPGFWAFAVGLKGMGGLGAELEVPGLALQG